MSVINEFNGLVLKIMTQPKAHDADLAFQRKVYYCLDEDKLVRSMESAIAKCLARIGRDELEHALVAFGQAHAIWRQGGGLHIPRTVGSGVVQPTGISVEESSRIGRKLRSLMAKAVGELYALIGE